MCFVEVKSEQAQVIGAIHRIRSGYIKARTACISRIGSLLLEFGVSLLTGHSVMKRLLACDAEASYSFHVNGRIS